MYDRQEGDGPKDRLHHRLDLWPSVESGEATSRPALPRAQTAARRCRSARDISGFLLSPILFPLNQQHPTSIRTNTNTPPCSLSPSSPLSLPSPPWPRRRPSSAPSCRSTPAAAASTTPTASCTRATSCSGGTAPASTPTARASRTRTRAGGPMARSGDTSLTRTGVLAVSCALGPPSPFSSLHCSGATGSGERDLGSLLAPA